MSISTFITLVNEGHEIEFVCEGRKYSVTYGEINKKEVISFCEFYQDSIEVETVDELLSIVYNNMRVSDMIEKLTDDDVWVYWMPSYESAVA